MNTVELATAFGRLSGYLADQGFLVEELRDFGQVAGLVEQAGKPYLTPITSPSYNDFTEQTALWFVAKRDGEVAFLGGARLEDLGSETLDAYWPRVLARGYPRECGAAPIANVRPEVVRAVRGRLVYFGDLFAARSARGNRTALRAFVALGHLSVMLKWNPDWIYCFVREADVLRGAAALYGFNSIFPTPFEWIDPPAPRDKSEWLAALSGEEVLPSVLATIRAVDRDIERRLDNQD